VAREGAVAGASPHGARRVPLRSLRGGTAALALLALIVAAPTRSAAVEVDDGATQVRLLGSLAAWHVFRLDPGTPRERPSSTLDLKLAADHGEWLHLTTSLRAGFDGKIGDPDRGNPVLGIDGIYQDKDVFLDFDEAFVELFFQSFELRLGKQKVSWGQLDEVQPTDNLNPEDVSEFFFRPELERKIGVPALRLTGYQGPWTGDLVWAPAYTAYRFPNRDDRWFPPLLEVPRVVDTPLGALPVTTRYPDVDPPPFTLASSDVGLRVTRFVRGAEVSASVFHGFDKQETFGAQGEASVVPTGDPAAPAAPSVDVAIAPTLHRITVVGADLAVPVWMLALRAEIGWIHGRFFPLLIQSEIGRDPDVIAAVTAAAERVAASGMAERIALPLPAVELRREALQYGIGFDYVVNEAVSQRLTGGRALAGTFVLLQLIETVIFRHDAPFIDDAVEHLLGLTLRQSFRDERIRAELKIAYNPNHGDFFLWPQLSYKLTATLSALLEARVIGGDPHQRIGQYRDHDGIKIGLRRYF
jgi:hypothetical protein